MRYLLGLHPVVLFLALSVAPALAQQTLTVNGWTLTIDAAGAIQSMLLLNPQTDLNVESELRFAIDGGTTASGGSIKFKNGAERPMGLMEATTFFDRFDGQDAIWDYLVSRGKVAAHKPMTATLSSMYGSKTRVVIDNGKKLIGTMTSDNNATDHFLLVIPGACCGPIPIYLNALSEIQQLK
jgi:hypothetical protein